MIADTTFLIHIIRERRAGLVGPARAFLARNRKGIVRTNIISLSEVAVSFPSSDAAWEYFKQWSVYRLHDGIANASADIDRLLRDEGQRLGENDNWIAGFAAYYRQPIISRDRDFDRAPGVRRISY